VDPPGIPSMVTVPPARGTPGREASGNGSTRLVTHHHRRAELTRLTTLVSIRHRLTEPVEVGSPVPRRPQTAVRARSAAVAAHFPAPRTRPATTDPTHARSVPRPPGGPDPNPQGDRWPTSVRPPTPARQTTERTGPGTARNIGRAHGTSLSRSHSSDFTRPDRNPQVSGCGSLDFGSDLSTS